MRMKQLTITKVVIILSLLIILGFLTFGMSEFISIDSNIEEDGGVAKEVIVKKDEDVVLPNVSEVTSTKEIVNTNNKKQVIRTPSQPVMSVVNNVKSSNGIKDLNMRQPAKTPIDAVEFFAKALENGDIDRAISYFKLEVQDGYRKSFEEYASNGHIHPVAQAFLNGVVDPVRLIDSLSGIYEIAIYPNASSLPFRVNVMYDNRTQEFVVTEL